MLLEQRRDADRTRQSVRIERVVQAGGRLIGPLHLHQAQAAALEHIMKRDGVGIADAVRAALAVHAGTHRKASKR